MYFCAGSSSASNTFSAANVLEELDEELKSETEANQTTTTPLPGQSF